MPRGAGLMTVKPLRFVEAGEGLTMLFERGAVIARGAVLLLRSPPVVPVVPGTEVSGRMMLFVRIGITPGVAPAGGGNCTADCGAFGTWAELEKIQNPKRQTPICVVFIVCWMLLFYSSCRV